MKLQRLIAILTILLQRDRVSAAILAEKFEVSVRTIYRDMESLEQAGIPIVTHTGVNGGFSILEQYKIEKGLFTHQDISTLLTSLHSISGPMSDAKVNQTLEKIRGLIPREYGKAIELTSKQLLVDMTPWSKNPLVTDTMAGVQKALEQSRLLCFDYLGRHSTSQNRVVEPLQLVLKENNWYLRAWCREREDLRTFKLTRIRNLELLPEEFEPREFESALDDFKDWRNDRMIHVDLIMDESLRERAMDFCREESFTDLGNGKIAVHMPFVESTIGYGVLLGLGHSCEVIGPPHVREELIRRIRLMLGLYE